MPDYFDRQAYDTMARDHEIREQDQHERDMARGDIKVCPECGNEFTGSQCNCKESERL